MPIAIPSLAPNVLRCGAIGLGRMGQRHAWNLAFAAPHVKLVAVCDVAPQNLKWARSHLPTDTALYDKAEDFFNHSGMDAVLVATETDSHAPLALQALRAGKHVLVEKPISVNQESAISFGREAAAFPHLKVMIGFSRRFDESYGVAKRMIDQDSIGRPFLIKSTTNDQYDSSGFFIAYSAKSGGIFMDCGIHDIDMARWLLGITPKDKIVRAFASGTNVRHPELAESGDADNALGFVEYESGKSFTFHFSRTAMHGHDCACEVLGSEAKLLVNQNPRMNRLDVADQYGVRTLSTPTYYERFKDAFVAEVNAFAHCCLNNTPSPVSIDDALEAGNIAQALTHAFRSGKPVYFDQDGQAIIA